MMHTAPPVVPVDFGFHHDPDTVKLCALFLEHWHMPPDVTLRQDRELLFDILRRVNLKDMVERATKDEHMSSVEEVLDWMSQENAIATGEAYEEQESDLPAMRF